MPDYVPPELIGVKLTNRSLAQTRAAAAHLEPDHWTNTTVTWFKPIDKRRLTYRIGAVLSNMSDSDKDYGTLQVLELLVDRLPDTEPNTGGQ